jgi:ABC-2 type transport system ATP-binding protein
MTAPAAGTASTATAIPAPTVEVANVSRWFGNVVAVNDISFTLAPGITGLLGPNGAGKSTLIHMLAGFLRPSRGDVRILGQPAWRNPAIYRSIGFVPERESVYGFLTGFEFVRLSARLHRLPAADAAAERAIAAVDMGFARDRATGGYSKGMKQRIKVAASLVHDPPVLILDEPFNGMDPRQRLHMMELLRRLAAEGRTILVSSHILEEVERLAETILVVVAGRLAAAGDFRAIRRLMTDRPEQFTLRSSDDRALAAALAAEPVVAGIEFLDGVLRVRTGDFAAFTRRLPAVAQERGVRLFEVMPADESLESVFSYLVAR